MGYSAGDLSVELFGIDTNAVASIDNTAKALKRLSSALRSIEKLQSIFIGNKIENIFDSIARATNSINTTNIERLASASQSLASISKISKLQNLDYGKIANGFNTLTVSITPFIDKIKTAEASLVALYGTLSKAGAKGMQNALNNPQNPKSPSSPFLFFSKITSVYFIARRLGRVVANIAQSGADYTETLNLWETAMSDNLDLANKFVDKMNEAYGISEKTLMNAQATFKNMLGSLGQISESTAYALSEGITQMAIDYASLYNVTFEKAFEKFQAALAGQVRPIRSVSGYDITENTLFELYKQLGGTKSVRNLSRTEKQLLSILAIFNQMRASGAVGDLDKTMESYANQSRIMAEAWKEFVSYVGILFTHILKTTNIIPFVSAILMYFTDRLKETAEQWGAIQSFGGDVFGEATESIYGTIDAVDELNGKLLDFDKFRALNDNEESAIAIDKQLLEALSRYDSILENVTNTAREMADSDWFKAIGLALDEIVVALTTMGSSAIISGIINLGKALKTTEAPIYALSAGIPLVISGIIQFAGAWNDMGDWQRAITIIASATAAIIGFFVAWKAFHTNVATAIGVGLALLGGVLSISSAIVENFEVSKFAEGGLPDKGTMFIAGEAGAEMVYNTPSGQSGVVNVQQIKQAMLGALIEYGQRQGGNQPIEVYLDGELVYRNTTAHAKKRGQVWGTV